MPGVMAALGVLCLAQNASAAGDIDPFALSPEQLFDATVVSVSRTQQKLGDAPAAIYLLTLQTIDRQVGRVA